ncbi:hypothetical protein SteCoe_24646 [Stentor coeruleus]|uniref:Uncharacterized protein n=1 Tax=Stentor coeruleus TaxID=5963 RepID=A0A1R2BH29_9CILI|nr:hypothetical protein SteCoe_24646 [Stentor coeruleus]
MKIPWKSILFLVSIITFFGVYWIFSGLFMIITLEKLLVNSIRWILYGKIINCVEELELSWIRLEELGKCKKFYYNASNLLDKAKEIMPKVKFPSAITSRRQLANFAYHIILNSNVLLFSSYKGLYKTLCLIILLSHHIKLARIKIVKYSFLQHKILTSHKIYFPEILKLQCQTLKLLSNLSNPFSDQSFIKSQLSSLILNLDTFLYQPKTNFLAEKIPTENQTTEVLESENLDAEKQHDNSAEDDIFFVIEGEGLKTNKKIYDHDDNIDIDKSHQGALIQELKMKFGIKETFIKETPIRREVPPTHMMIKPECKNLFEELLKKSLNK